MAGKLPKVTEYIKNVGKSIGYASIDAVTESTEGISSFLETNDEFFKTIYSAGKNYKRTLIAADKAIRRSKLYDAVTAGIKNTKEDLLSGNWYNKERDSQMQMAAFGEEFADFSDFEVDLDSGDWDMDDDEDIISHEPENKPKISMTDKVIAQAANTSTSSIVGATREQSHIIANSAENIVGVNIATAKMLSMQNEKLQSSILTGFQSVHGSLNIISSMMTGPMTTYMNESTKFYTDTSSKLTEVSAYLKEMTEMQRNLYKAQQTEYNQSKYDEVVDSNNMPDLKAYAKRIYKNVLDLDPTGGLLFGDGDENPLKAMMGSPLKFLPKKIIQTIIPTTVNAAMKAFDENMKGFFPSFIAKMNQWAEEEGDGEINFKGIIGSLLGIKPSNKTTLNTGNYNKGAMPFDGETKKAIVDVIPMYLSRIESSLSGQPERIYDYGTGKFKTAREIHKEFKQKQLWAQEDAASSIETDLNNWGKEKKNMSKLQRQKFFREVANELYKNGGRFDVENTDLQTIFGSQEDILDFVNYVREKGRTKNIYEIAGNTFRARDDYTKQLEEIEKQFGNPLQVLFNNHLLTTDAKGKIKAFNPTAGIDLNADEKIFKRDKRFKTSNDYLKDILANLIYIRENLGRGFGSGKKKKRTTTNPVRTIDEIQNSLNEEENFEHIEAEKDELNRPEEEKEKSQAEKYGLTKDNVLKNIQAAKTFSDKWKAIRRGIDETLQKPAKVITSIINKADQRLFDALFGSADGIKKKDKEGREYNGLLDYLVTRSSEIFDEVKNKVKKAFDTYFEKFKNSAIGKKIIALKDKTKTALSSKFGAFKRRGKSAYDKTYGVGVNAIANELRRRGIIGADDISNAMDGPDYDQFLGDYDEGPIDSEDYDYTQLDDNGNPIQHSALGRVVQKYGLSMVSPGEIIIPNRGKGRQEKDLRNEKKEKSKILKLLKRARISHNAKGTVPNDGKPRAKTDTDILMGNVKKVMRQVGGQEGDIIADSLIGGGVSLLTGAIGGPLLGAAVGASYGLVKNSEFLQEKLFGKKDEQGDRKGGLIPKSVTDFFKKHSEGMIDFGMAGAVAGLFTPLGLVGGAMAGAALGYAKDTKWFKDFMFGNETEGKEGLLSKETQNKIKESFPTIAAGAGAGILLGPFGLVGNALLGSAAGYVSTTDTFRNVVLGEMGDDGKRHGGVVGAFKEGLVDPLISKGKEIVTDLAGFAMKHVIEPTKLAFQVGNQFVKNVFTSIGDRVSDALSGVFEKHVGMPFEEFLREKVFKRIARGLGFISKIPIMLLKGTVGLPFELLRGGANMMMMSQIRRGKSHLDSAAARNEQRGKHKILNRLGGRDNFSTFDTELAGMDEDQLYQLRENLNTFIGARGKSNKEYNDKIKDIGSQISSYIDQNGGWDMKGVKYNGKKQILEALQRGERPNDALLKKYGLEGLRGTLDSIDMDSLNAMRDKKLNEAGMTDETIKALEKVTGIKNIRGHFKGNNRTLNTMLRNLDKELKFRSSSRIAAENAEEGEEVKPYEPIEFNEKMTENTTKIVDILTSINNYLADPDSKKRKPILYSPNGERIVENKPQTKRENAEMRKKMHEDTLSEEEKEKIDQRTGARKLFDFLYGNAEKEGGIKKAKKFIGSNVNKFGRWLVAPKSQSEDEEVNPDSLEGNEQKEKEKKENKFKEVLLSSIVSLNGFIGKLIGRDKDDKEEKKNQSLISRIFGGMKGFGSGILSLLGGIGGGLKTIGIIGAGVGGLALLGWGSEFWKTKVSPWFEENAKPFFSGLLDKLEQSETFQKVKGFVVGIQKKWEDGTIVKGLVDRLTQGVGFAFKNVIGPLTEAIISSFPDLVMGIAGGVGKGVWKLIFGEKTKTVTNFNGYLASANSKMPVGKDEESIAKSFSGSRWIPGKVNDIDVSTDGISINNSNGTDLSNVINQNAKVTRSGQMSNYKTYSQNGEYVEEDGSKSVVNGNTVERYDRDGKFIGSYNQSTGYIQQANINQSYTGGVSHAAKNAILRSAATGSVGLLGRISNKLASSKIVSGSSIAKSFLQHTSIPGFIGGAVSGGAKTAAKVTAGGVGAGSTIGKAIYDKLTGIAGKAAGAASEGNWADWIAQNADDVATSGGGIFSKIGNGIVKGATAIGSKIGSVLPQNGLISKCLDMAKKALDKVLGEDGVITKFIIKHSGKAAKLVTPLCKNLAEKAAEMIAKGGLSKVGGTLLAKLAANTSPLAIVTWSAALASGFTKPESILGIAKETLDLPLGARALVAVIHALNENIFLGLLPTSKIADLVFNAVGDLFGVTTEDLNQARKDTEMLLAQAGLETGNSDITIEDYNNQNSIVTRLLRLTGFQKDPMKDYDKNKDNDISDSSGSGRKEDIVSKAKGKGRGGSQGGKYANLPYGKSTIGEAGCAPVAASMIGNSSIPEAAAFAQRTGHVAPDGSTDIGFFNDYFSAKGISHKTTTDKSFTEKALQKGGSAVLLGRDPGGGDQSAYSDSSHFITAKGMDRRGNVMIDDPEMGSRIMKKNDVFRNMKASVVTGKGRYDANYDANSGLSGTERREKSEKDAEYFASIKGLTGSELRDAGKISKTTDSSYQENVNKILKVARSQLGKTEKPINDCIYNDEYYGKHVSGSSYPWCCAFVWWVFHHAGADALITKTASCTNMMQWFGARNQIVKTAQPGDLLFFNFDKTKAPGVAKHIGICVEASKNGKTVKSIEGNTSSGKSGSQDNGGGVFERDRDLSNVVAIARPAYQGASFDDAVPYGSYDYATGEESSGSSGVMGLFDKLAALGKLAVKAIFGDGLYNAVFGGSDSTSSSSGGSGNANIGYAADPALPSNVGEDDKLQGTNSAERIWKYLRSLGYSKAGTAGIMGNLVKESGLQSNNLQNTFNRKFGVSDADYTKSVNNGSYSKSKFTGDKAGYGLAQWTYSSRKSGLFDATVGKNRPIDSEKNQLDYLSRELTQYGLSDQFKSAGDVAGASDYFLTQFEKPANMEQQKPIRRKAAQSFYDQFSGLGRKRKTYTTNQAVGMSGKGRDDGSFNTVNNPTSAVKTTASNAVVTSNIRNPSVTNSSKQLAYAAFLETIVDILLSISGNTEVLTKILDILSNNFDIKVNTEEIQKSTKSTKERARAALNNLMSNKTDAETVSHMLQTRDTDWLVRSMTELAKE